ncbi:MAG TPA: OmpA family protein [Caulobacteraceae bacterium]|jgi:outer membrane protein OmpA-like peptidoglycan-associated protein|nr:OmpA family protein [Caulobacteraceae bacterium]
MVLSRKPSPLAAGMAAILAATSLAGCATKSFVRTEVGVVDTKLQATQGQVDASKTTIAQHETRLGQVDATAKDALQRANAAGALAEGKFNYSVLLTDDAVKFGPNAAKLSEEAQSRLTSLAEKLKTDNKNVYIEVQGHNDKTEAATLGQQRAEAVRLFLNRQGVPLNRIGSISYGATDSVAPSNTREGRAQNRRVVVVVLS